MSDRICQLQNVTKTYKVRQGFFKRKSLVLNALDDISLDLCRDEIVGLVGESGCGKSTLARITLGLEFPDTGRVRFYNTDISKMDKSQRKTFRKKAQMVFQDPFSSLNPKKTIFQTLKEPLMVHNLCTRKDAIELVENLLEDVGLDSSASDRYPHEFSGGQRQRIGIARALATSPDMIIADEPTSALDVSIQAQIINLLLDIQEKRAISVLFISHDLPLVKFVSHRIAVMYKGQIVEIMPGKSFGKSLTDTDQEYHPYTSCLLQSVPMAAPELAASKRKSFKKVKHEKDRSSISSGCSFATLCPEAMDVCFKRRPKLKLFKNNRMTACHARKA